LTAVPRADQPITLFSFGYWGWGNAAARLVEAIDAAEASRGYAPPLFVDTRISRSVRAHDFSGNAFEHLVDPARYRWMDDLGNLAIRQGGPMRIRNPAAADTLLALALQDPHRRVLFYCACEVPGQEGAPTCCHRTLVAGLVLGAAQRRAIGAEIVEWPGGEPRNEPIDIALARSEFDKVRRGARAIPLHDALPLARAAALPWYAPVLVHPDDDEGRPSWRLLTGPVRYRSDAWWLPVLAHVEAEPADAMRAEIRRLREAGGYEPRRSTATRA